MANNSKLNRNKRTPARQAQRMRQPARSAANKIRKIKKHLRKYPDDQQSNEALKRAEGAKK